MTLRSLKRTIARVEVDGTSNGTAFLVDRAHVATALHVLDGHSQVTLFFVEWPDGDRKRIGRRTWRHADGHDVAILALDRECPGDVQPVPWGATTPSPDDRWSTFGFPAQVPFGHVLSDEIIKDPSQLVIEWGERILQLDARSAEYDLGGFSGAPCAIAGAIVGVITHQLRRTAATSTGSSARVPALNTLYALPIALLAPSGIAPPMFEQDELPAGLVELAEALAGQAKASLLAAMLRAMDRAAGETRTDGPQRAAIARRLRTAFRLVVHLVWRRANARARTLAHEVYERLTRSAVAQTSPGLRVPIFLHDEPSFLSECEPRPIDPDQIEHTVIVVLLDDEMVLDDGWRACHDRIVELTDRDAAGTSVAPIDLGSPKRVAPFDTMNVGNLADNAPTSQLLIAIELHVLQVLARRRGDAPDQDPARLFLSYASVDGDAAPLAVRRLAEETAGVDALFDKEALAPGDRHATLEKKIEGRVLVAFVTASYASRPWCRLELLTAKRLGMPIVVVDAHDADVPRAFPYLGNVPWVRAGRGRRVPHDILEAAIFEQLRHEYARFHLEDQKLLDDELRCAHIVPRPPELLDVVHGGALAQLASSIVLHPDPPISVEEQTLLRQAAPGVRFVSPGQVVADAQPLRWPDGRPLRIGLSASPPDVRRAGVSELHFEDTWLDLNRLLLLSGATLVFGGDLRPGGLTDLLLDLAEQRTMLERRTGRNARPPIVSHLAWPAYLDLTAARRAQLRDRVAFCPAVPPASKVAIYPDHRVEPTTPDARYLWARSLTGMRCIVRDDVTAMIVVGGKCTEYIGRYAGVVEETFLAMQRGLPVFLLGGLGGATAAIGEVLTRGTSERLTAGFQLRADVAPGEQAFVDHYNDAVRQDANADASSAIDHDGVVAFLADRGLAGLNNGLSEPENRLLLASPAMQEVTPVLLKGLRHLLTRPPDH